uniref:Uncharacterized protein n=1 Tax=Trichogramma kaykai TaxID=54128 RepID=A0ABD2XRA7_9HYME
MNFVPLTVHWDGKSVKDNDVRVEFLPVVITCGSQEQFLHCGILDHGTGSSISNAVYKSLNEWDTDIISMCYDTTSFNTGHQCLQAVGVKTGKKSPQL